MKSGICPKCNSKEIYVVDDDQTIVIPLGMLSTSAFATMYICAKCGFVEFYVDDKSDLQQIARKYRKF